MDFIEEIEFCLNKKAKKKFMPMQQEDVSKLIQTLVCLNKLPALNQILL